MSSPNRIAASADGLEWLQCTIYFYFFCLIIFQMCFASFDLIYVTVSITVSFGQFFFLSTVVFTVKLAERNTLWKYQLVFI